MNYFENELKYIKDDSLRTCAKKIIALLPDYFFHIPASSTGKYHPTFSLNDGGLYRHSVAAVRIAHELLELEMYQSVYNEHERDLIIISIMFHDGLKKGLNNDEYTTFSHPVIMADYLKGKNSEIGLNTKDLEFITNCIASHMGEWNTDKYSGAKLPKPSTKAGKFVHMCDFLASRKFLNINFNEKNEIKID